MRISISFCFFLFSIIANGQTPQLVYAHSYGQGTNNSEEGIRSIEFWNDSIVISGRVIGNANVGLNSDVFLNSENAEPVGIYMVYDAQGNYLESSVLGRIVNKAIASQNNFCSIGNFQNEIDFDLTNSSPMIVDTILFGTNNFICSHDESGFLNWFGYGSFTAGDIFQNELGLVLTGDYSVLNLAGISDTLEIDSEGGNEGLIAIMDIDNGEILEYKTFPSVSNDILRTSSQSQILNEFSVGGRLDGSSDFDWMGESNISFNHPGSAPVVVSYSNDLQLNSLLIFLNLETLGNDARITSVVYDQDGNMYAGGFLLDGSYEMRLNDYSENLDINIEAEMFLVKVNAQKELQWMRRMPVDGYSYFLDFEIDHNGFLNAVGSFDTFMEFDGTTTILNGSQESGFLARWTPEGDLVWAYTITDGGVSPVYDMCVTPQNEMFIGGAFTTYGTDFDLTTEGSYDLGLANGKDAFLAKYTISNPTPDVFVEQGWQTTEVTEAGATDAVYVRLSHAPSSPVQVIATPNAQLDLGNGQGVPITLNFAADATAVQQQLLTVTAFDDLIIENLHSGLITFTINSNDSEFNGLIENAINVVINDNDVIGVEELNSSAFSLSPNPATDQLMISFASSQQNNTINVFDESGKLVLSQQVNGTQDRVNISELAVGTYSLSIQIGSNIFSKVFLKK